MSKLNNKEMSSKILDQIITLTIVTTSLIVFPWLKLDSTNLPKFVTLTSGGFACLIIIILSLKKILASEFRNLTFIYLSFIFVSTLVIFLADLENSTQLFGRLGRNTGYLSYISLFSILMVTSIISTKNMQGKFLILTLLVSSISLLIGYLQVLEISPIRNISDFGKVVGFFSNVNFHSAFIGILITILLPYLLSKSVSSLSKKFIFILLLLGILQILISESIQGFLIFLISSSITIGLFLRVSSAFKVLIPYIMINLIILFMGLIALQNKGPLASFIYEASIKARGDYWAAGWKITTLHPWFGVGFDGYGDWYRRTRTVESVLSSNKDVTTDAAHNVFLDISSSGGSLISINQLGLAIWGWVLTGLIIGYEINTRVEQAESSPLAGARGLKIKALSGLLVGAIIAGLPLINLSRVESAAANGNLENILKISKQYPNNIGLIEQTLISLYEQQRYGECLELAKYATLNFENSYVSWKVLSLLPGLDIAEVNKIRVQLNRLDPLFEKI